MADVSSQSCASFSQFAASNSQKALSSCFDEPSAFLRHRSACFLYSSVITDILRCSTTANDPAHRRITPEPVGIVHVLVPGKASEHRLPQHPDQIMPTVPARASISQILPRDLHQSEGIVQLAIGQQAGVGGDIGAVELELQSAVEIEPRSDSPVGCAMIALDPMR